MAPRMQSNLRRLLLSVLLFTLPAVAHSQPAPDIVLNGEVHSAQNKTYIEAPFTVPPGVASVWLRVK